MKAVWFSKEIKNQIHIKILILILGGGEYFLNVKYNNMMLWNESAAPHTV